MRTTFNSGREPRLPVLLDNIRIATPCNADWDEMTGDDRVRFCGKCEKNVYDLSSLSRIEAEKLVGEREGRMCVRFYQRPDGTMLTADCPVAVEKKRLRARIWARISGAAASLALLVGLHGGRARADVSVTENRPVGQKPIKHFMGKMAPPEKPPEPSKPPKKPQAKMGDVGPA
jgi:hypothetical protein